jgi:hypothetical protein
MYALTGNVLQSYFFTKTGEKYLLYFGTYQFIAKIFANLRLLQNRNV